MASEEALKRKKEYIKKWQQEHKAQRNAKNLTVGCTFRRDLEAEYIEIWQKIPDKKQFMKDCLEMWRKNNK